MKTIETRPYANTIHLTATRRAILTWQKWSPDAGECDGKCWFVGIYSRDGETHLGRRTRFFKSETGARRYALANIQ